MFASVFVTVGTTEFDQLLRILDTSEFLQYLTSSKCKELVIQHGRGVYEVSYLPDACKKAGISLDVFRFSGSLTMYMQKADLIISHAGAGTVTEALSLHKNLLVVVNTTLMDNHQTELADAVANRGYCFATVPEKVMDVLQSIDFSNKTKYPEVNHSLFPELIDSIFR